MFREGHGINGSNVLFGSIVLIVLVFMKLRAQIIGFVAVAAVAWILFEAHQDDGLVVLHALAEQRSYEKLGMIWKHDFLLDAASA